jgi:hypothetical protein
MVLQILRFPESAKWLTLTYPNSSTFYINCAISIENPCTLMIINCLPFKSKGKGKVTLLQAWTEP